MGRYDQRRRVGFGHATARRQLGHGAGGSISERVQRRLQDDQQTMNPLMGVARAHPEQPPLHDLERVSL
jgi:hypothetical protein